MADHDIKSILAVDCGSATTTAILIEPVDGEFRLVATGQTPSTYASPWQDITLGVNGAIRQIEKLTNRTILAPGGWPFTPQSSSKQGVDAYLVVSSAGEPLRVLLAGLIHDITLASARRAAATTYSAITNILSLDPERSGAANGTDQNQRQSAEARIQAVRKQLHEVILLTGGTDGGARRPVADMANVLSMALRLQDQAERPFILYAGNSAARAEIAEILGTVSGLKPVDNIRPTLETENLIPIQAELENLYVQHKMLRLPGFEKLANWSNYPIIPASKSFERVVAYLGRHNQLNVLGVDLGSRSTVVSTQVAEHHHAVIRSDAGIGHSLTTLLKIVPLEKFQRWLPFSIQPEDLKNRLLNRSLSPTAIPTTFEDLMIEHAVAREAIRLVVEQARAGLALQSSIEGESIHWNLVIGAGRTLTRTPHPGYAAIALLDGVEPWGVTSLALDISGATNMLGAIAAVQPVAAVEVAIRDTFLNLGTIIAPIGHGLSGRSAVKLKIDQQTEPQETDGENQDAGAAAPPLEIDVPYGSIEIVPLPPGRKATVEIRPTRHFDIGLGQPGRGAVTEIEGGILGIIIDARGRPLRLPRDEIRRHELLRQWLTSLDISHAASDQND